MTYDRTDPRERNEAESARQWRADPYYEQLLSTPSEDWPTLSRSQRERLELYVDAKRHAVRYGYSVDTTIGSVVSEAIGDVEAKRQANNDALVSAGWQPDAGMERALELRETDPAKFREAYGTGSWELAWYEKGRKAVGYKPPKG